MVETAADQLLTEWTAFRAQDTERSAEIARLGTASQETQNRLEALAQSVTDIGVLAAKLNRPDLGGHQGSRRDERTLRHYAQWESVRTGQRLSLHQLDDGLITGIEQYNDAYRAYLNGRTTGEQMGVLNTMGRLGGNPQNAMSSGDLGAGGYLIAPEIDMDIMTQIVETSPMRRLAKTRTITGKEIGGRRRTGRASATWVYETQSRSNTTTPTIGMWRIMAHEIYAQPADTQENLDDVSFDLEGWLTGELASEFGYAENTAFVGGTGVGQPRGFTTYASGVPSESSWDVIEQVVSGAATAVTADGIVDLVGALKTDYLSDPSCGFVLRRATMTKVLELKDGEGTYLMRPDFTQGFTWRIVGFPATEFPDMPAIGAGNLAIGFGAWAQAYLIVDRRDSTMLRDPYTNKPYVNFYTTKRVGGDVVNPEAIKLQKISA